MMTVNTGGVLPLLYAYGGSWYGGRWSLTWSSNMADICLLPFIKWSCLDMRYPPQKKPAQAFLSRIAKPLTSILDMPCKSA